MKTNTAILTMALGLGLLNAANAEQGIMLRGGVSYISPNISSGNLSEPSFTNTKVDIKSAATPSGGITLILSEHCTLDFPIGIPSRHRIVGADGIAGVGDIGSATVAPLTLLGQYRFRSADAKVRPYVGIGGTYAIFSGERTTAALSGMTGGTTAKPTQLQIDDAFAATFQVGVSIKLQDNWSFDANYIKALLSTTAHLSTGQSIKADLDPDVVSVGFAYRYK